MGELGFSEAIPLLRLICENVEDPWVRYYGSSSLLRLGDKEGIHRLIQILKDPGPPFLKVQVEDLLVEVPVRISATILWATAKRMKGPLTAGRSGGTKALSRWSGTQNSAGFVSRSNFFVSI